MTRPKHGDNPERQSSVKHRWFDVDKEGLRCLIERQGKGRLIGELIQNALDEVVKRIDIALTMEPGRPRARLVVTDDCADGWRDLTQAYTLFAESYKKTDPAKRGRFNLGEKLVLAMCEEARIVTTTGSVTFQSDGTRTAGRAKRAVGSEFAATLRMTRAEFDSVSTYLHGLIVPANVTVTYNGDAIAPRTPLHFFEASLETDVADDDGVLRRRVRRTRVEVYATLSGEVPSLYEIGLPVVETGDKWHVNVLQKVPDLNFNRDNAPPAFLRTLRTLVTNEMHELLTEEDVAKGWVTDATRDATIIPDAMARFLDLRFGKHRAAYDPSDPEANKRFVADGGTLVTGGMLAREQWDNAKKHGLIQPTGKICPSPRPYSDDPRANSAAVVPPEKWSEGMTRIADYARFLGEELLGVSVMVTFVSTPNHFTACYGPGRLDFNLLRLSRKWFDQGVTEQVDELLIHEFGHHFSGDHLSSAYHDALCRLGAKLKRLALQKSEAFRRFATSDIAERLA